MISAIDVMMYCAIAITLFFFAVIFLNIAGLAGARVHESVDLYNIIHFSDSIANNWRHGNMKLQCKDCGVVFDTKHFVEGDPGKDPRAHYYKVHHQDMIQK